MSRLTAADIYGLNSEPPVAIDSAAPAAGAAPAPSSSPWYASPALWLVLIVSIAIGLIGLSVHVGVK